MSQERERATTWSFPLMLYLNIEVLVKLVLPSQSCSGLLVFVELLGEETDWVDIKMGVFLQQHRPDPWPLASTSNLKHLESLDVENRGREEQARYKEEGWQTLKLPGCRKTTQKATSSRYTSQFGTPESTSDISHWNAPGAFLRSKGITLYCKKVVRGHKRWHLWGARSQGHLPITLKQVQFGYKFHSQVLNLNFALSQTDFPRDERSLIRYSQKSGNFKRTCRNKAVVGGVPWALTTWSSW